MPVDAANERPGRRWLDPAWRAYAASGRGSAADRTLAVTMGNVTNRWRRWIPGPRHGLPRGVAVYGVPRLDPEQLDGLLGRCHQLHIWARAHGFELEGVPEDLGLLD